MLDTDGKEMEWNSVPLAKRPDNDSCKPWKKGMGMGKGNDWSCDADRRDRSRSRGQKRWEKEDSDHANKRDSAIIPPVEVRPKQLVVSTVELDHMMDCVTRSIKTNKALASYCKQSQQTFETFVALLKECKHGLELS